MNLYPLGAVLDSAYDKTWATNTTVWRFLPRCDAHDRYVETRSFHYRGELSILLPQELERKLKVSLREPISLERIYNTIVLRQRGLMPEAYHDDMSDHEKTFYLRKVRRYLLEGQKINSVLEVSGLVAPDVLSPVVRFGAFCSEGCQVGGYVFKLKKEEQPLVPRS